MNNDIVVIPAEEVREKTGSKRKKLRVAAYCRVSTDEERQLGSFENQIEYFTNLIESNGRYELVEIFSDEGISGCSTRRRAGFRSMIEACEAGRIDLIITKSISRFARNTQDSLNYTRRLKDMGIGVCFEKEGINTMESSGELLLTLFSCFAQEESRSISENTSWGIRGRFQQGIPHLNAGLLLGYEKNAEGKLVIDETQAPIVRRIYREFLEGFSLNAIARGLNEDEVAGVHGRASWCANTIGHILDNEKYKGALLMQKTYTANYLTKQSVKNTGQLNQYYVEHDHPAIIPPALWEAVRMERARRRAFVREHGLRGMFGPGSDSPWYARLFCRPCGAKLQRIFRKGVPRPYWLCPSCGARIDEEKVRDCFCRAFNRLVDERDARMGAWEHLTKAGTPLDQVRAAQIIEITAGGPIPYEVPELTRMVLQEAWLEGTDGPGEGLSPADRSREGGPHDDEDRLYGDGSRAAEADPSFAEADPSFADDGNLSSCRLTFVLLSGDRLTVNT